MSFRYQGAWIQAGLFNPLAAPPPILLYNLYTWGQNNYGQLGLGNTTNYSSPKQVGSLTNWTMLAGSEDFSAAIKTDGTLWTWGRNNLGQLGLGNRTYYSSPKQVGALTNWSTIAPQLGGAMAIKSGALWVWGQNGSGQLGLGDITTRSSPTQLGTATTWNLAGWGAYSALTLG